MTSTITSSPIGFTTTNAPSSQAPTEVWGRLATPASSTAKRATATTGPPVTRQSVEQVKASATAFVDKCWKNYASIYPEAFSARANGATAKAPTLVFLETQAEVDRIRQSSGDTKELIAFVKSDDPTRVYVHTPNLVKYSNKFGPNYVKTTMSHELIHNLTHGVTLRMQNDADGKTASYSTVQQDLTSIFQFDVSKSPGAKSAFSVRRLISEFSAEHYASKATGLQSFSAAYALLRSTGEKLLQVVGEAVFRKAVLTNDPAAYRQVVEAATALQQQNVKANLLNEKSECVALMRAAQVAAPFGTTLNARTLDKLEIRYLRESDLYSNLAKNFPDQIKNFDFRFMDAVDAKFKGKSSFYDSDRGDASRRELFGAIKAVWPSLK
jgi:hypothetical protein